MLQILSIYDVYITLCTSTFMESKEIAESLQKLASDKTKRNKTGILREVLGDIEVCLDAGISQTDIVKVLNEHGLNMTLGTFASTLRRIRLQRANIGNTNRKPFSTMPKGNSAVKPDKPAPPIIPDVQNRDHQNVGEEENQQTIFNPSDLRAVLSEKVDLNELAKIGRELRRKKKHEERSD